MSQLQRLAWRTRNWRPGEGRWEVRVRSGREGKTAPGRGAGASSCGRTPPICPPTSGRTSLHLPASSCCPPNVLGKQAQRGAGPCPRCPVSRLDRLLGGFESHTRPAQCTGGGGQGGAPAVWAWSLRYGAGGPFQWPGCGGRGRECRAWLPSRHFTEGRGCGWGAGVWGGRERAGTWQGGGYGSRGWEWGLLVSVGALARVGDLGLGW